MRIALPVWQDKVSPLLDTASRLLVVVAERERETSRFETYLEEMDISRRCQRIHSLKIDVLICGALSRAFSTMLMAAGTDVISGITGRVEDVLKAYFHKTIFDSNYLMPGYGTDSPIQTDPSSRYKKEQPNEIPEEL